MTECPKHKVALQTRQIDTATWEEACPVCEQQEYVRLKSKVAAMWERLGMPVDTYTVEGFIGGVALK